MAHGLEPLHRPTQGRAAARLTSSSEISGALGSCPLSYCLREACCCRKEVLYCWPINQPLKLLPSKQQSAWEKALQGVAPRRSGAAQLTKSNRKAGRACIAATSQKTAHMGAWHPTACHCTLGAGGTGFFKGRLNTLSDLQNHQAQKEREKQLASIRRVVTASSGLGPFSLFPNAATLGEEEILRRQTGVVKQGPGGAAQHSQIWA